MKVYKTKEFARLARKSNVSDLELCEVVDRAERGMIDANIGRHLIKQRVARKDAGRSGGHRVIVVYKAGDIAVFLHLFPKSAKANLTPHEEETYRNAAKVLAELDAEATKKLIAAGEWKEVDYEGSRKDVPERSAPVGPSGDEGPPQGRRDR